MPTELKFTLLVEEGLLHILSLKCLSVLTLAVLSSNSYFTLEMFPDPWCQGGIFSFCHYFLMLTQFLALKRPGALAALSQSGWWPQECHSGWWMIAVTVAMLPIHGHLVALTMLHWGAESGIIPCAVLGHGWINPNANPWSTLSQEDSCAAESLRQESQDCTSPTAFLLNMKPGDQPCDGKTQEPSTWNCSEESLI